MEDCMILFFINRVLEKKKGGVLLWVEEREVT